MTICSGHRDNCDVSFFMFVFSLIFVDISLRDFLMERGRPWEIVGGRREQRNEDGHGVQRTSHPSPFSFGGCFSYREPFRGLFRIFALADVKRKKESTKDGLSLLVGVICM